MWNYVFNEKSSAQSIKMGFFHYFQVDTHIIKNPIFVWNTLVQCVC
jgi:hypothetical protein